MILPSDYDGTPPTPKLVDCFGTGCMPFRTSTCTIRPHPLKPLYCSRPALAISPLDFEPSSPTGKAPRTAPSLSSALPPPRAVAHQASAGRFSCSENGALLHTSVPQCRSSRSNSWPTIGRRKARVCDEFRTSIRPESFSLLRGSLSTRKDLPYSTAESRATAAVHNRTKRTAGEAR